MPSCIERAISLFYNAVHSLCLEGLFPLSSLSSLRGRAGSGGSGGSGGVSSGSASNLESNAAAKWTGTVVVGDLQEAEVALSTRSVGSSTCGSSGNLDRERLEIISFYTQPSSLKQGWFTHCIGANICRTLSESSEDFSHTALDDVAVSVADHVRCGHELRTCGVRTCTGGVNNGKEVSVRVVGSAVTGDNSPSSGDGPCTIRRHLRQGGTGLSNSFLEIGNL